MDKPSDVTEQPTKTHTCILADGGFVQVQHSRLVGTQFLSADDAERMALALLEAANQARSQRGQKIQ